MLEFDGSREYGYDISGRISMIGDTEYKYDALGRLAISTTGSVSTYYYYDAAGRVIAEYSTDDNGQTLDFERSFIWGSGFNEIIAMDDGVSLKYMFTDALGSVTAVYDAATSTAEFTTYDAYGNSETAPASPYGYAGMRVAMFTDNCSLYITPNRAYSPKLGRWLQPDPLGTTPNPQTGNVYSPLKQYSDGTNLYAYVGNDPVSKIDILGLVCGSGWSERIVPDKFRNVYFIRPCIYHDRCYEGKGKYNCNTRKKDCDEELRRNMKHACQSAQGYCDAIYDPFLGGYREKCYSKREVIAQCENMADIYYKGLQLLGCPAFKKARTKSNCCLKDCLPPQRPTIDFPNPVINPYF